jgi:hypothetical protein
MSSADQPYIDPSEIPLEGSAAERFKSPKDAFWSGMRDAAGAPAMVLFAGMVDFGAMGKTNGFDVWFTTFTSFFMFARPGCVARDGDYRFVSAGDCLSGDLNIDPLYYDDRNTLSAVSSKGS